MALRDEVLLPLVALVVLALVSSAALAAIIHGVIWSVQILSRQSQDSRRAVVVARLVRTGAILAVAAMLVWWFAHALLWQPIAELDISQSFDASDSAVAFSPDNKLLALGSFNGFVELRQLPSLKRIAHYDVDLHNGVRFVEFSEDGTRLIYGSQFDPRVRIMDVISGEQHVEVNAGGQLVFHLASKSQLLAVVTVSANNCFETTVWDMKSDAKVFGSLLEDPGWAPVVHLDRGLLAYMKRVGDNSTIKTIAGGKPTPSDTISLHRLRDGRLLADGPTVRNATSHFRPCFSKNGDWVCMQSVVWNHETQVTHEVPGHGMGFLPNGQLVLVQTATSGPDFPIRASQSTVGLFRTPFIGRWLLKRFRSRVVLYDVESRRTMWTGPWLEGSVFVWLSPDGTRMATLAGANLKIWDINTN
jgi:WD40 repeat protein